MWCQTRRQTQVPASAGHSSPLNELKIYRLMTDNRRSKSSLEAFSSIKKKYELHFNGQLCLSYIKYIRIVKWIHNKKPRQYTTHFCDIDIDRRVFTKIRNRNFIELTDSICSFVWSSITCTIVIFCWTFKKNHEKTETKTNPG